MMDIFIRVFTPWDCADGYLACMIESCGKPTFTTDDALGAHMKGIQNLLRQGRKLKDSTVYRWECLLCSFKSHQKNRYVRHLTAHTKSQPYECPLCDHETARKVCLWKHIGKSHSYAIFEEVEASHLKPCKIEEEEQQESAKFGR